MVSVGLLTLYLVICGLLKLQHAESQTVATTTPSLTTLGITIPSPTQATTQNPICNVPYSSGTEPEDVFNLTDWIQSEEQLGKAIALYIGTGDENDNFKGDLFTFMQGMMLASKEGKVGGLDTSTKPVLNIMVEYYRRKYAVDIPNVLRYTPEETRQYQNFLLQSLVKSVDEELFYAYTTAVIANASLKSGTNEEKAQAVEKYFRAPMALYGLPYESFKPAEVDGQCFNDTIHSWKSLLAGRGWAFQMVDAWGKIPTGILQGNPNFLGSYEGCYAVKADHYDDNFLRNANVTSTSVFEGDYCDLKMNLPESLNFPTPPGAGLWVTYGMCFPSTCTSNDVRIMMSGLLTSVGLPLMVNDSTRCHSDSPLAKGQLTTDPFAMAALGTAAGIAALVIICTIIEGTFIRSVVRDEDDDGQKGKESERNGQSNKAYEPEVEMTDISQQAGADDSKPNGKDNSTAVKHSSKNYDYSISQEVGPNKPAHKDTKPPGYMVLFIKSFSLYTNVPLIMATQQRKGIIKGMDALRFLSMCWIMLGHIYSYNGVFILGAMSNLKESLEVLQEFGYQAIFSAVFAVDTFFLISGALVTFMFLKQVDRQKGLITIPQMFLFYFHRIWRLTPMYMLLVFLMAGLGEYLGSGPLFDWQSPRVFDCKNNWWTNLLYINNFVENENMCLGWSWYLSNDMQFYIFSPLILIPLAIWVIPGLVILAIEFLIYFIVTAYLWSLTEGKNYLSDAHIYNDAYIKPYSRMSPYLVGILLGWVLYNKIFKGRFKLRNKIVVAVMWIAALGVIFASAYAQYDVNRHGFGNSTWTTFERTLYETVSRPIFALGVAWILYALNTGNAGFLHDILEWPGFAPLGRLTFATYLIHPILMLVYIGNMRSLIHVDYWNTAWLFGTYLSLGYGAGFVLSLLFELPAAGLETILLTATGLKKK